MSFHKELLLLLGQRSAEGGFHQGEGKILQLLRAIRRAFFRAGEFVQIFHHMLGSGDGGVRGGLIPAFGNGSAALIAHAAVIRRKARAHDHEFTRTLGAQRMLRDDFRHAMRWLPPQLDGGRLLLEFEMIQPQPVGATTHQEEALLLLTHRGASAHPGIDQGIVFTHVIDPQPRAVFRLEGEFIHARLRCQHAAFPGVLKLIRLHLLLVRAVGTKVECHLRIHTIKLVVRALGFDAFFRCGIHRRLTGLGQFRATIIALQSCFSTDGAIKSRPHAETPDQVHHRSAILRDGQSAQILVRRMTARLRCTRIKGIINVRRHLLRILSHAGALLVLRHRALDLTRQRLQREIARERIIILVLHALTLGPVALLAHLLVNDGTRMLGCVSGRSQEPQRQPGVS